MKPFLAYARARENTESVTRSYRAYVTDSLQLSGQNKYLATRWADSLAEETHDSRTPEEIVAGIIQRAGLTLEEGE